MSSEVFGQGERTARKPHRCVLCCYTIRPTYRYLRWCCTDGGQAFTLRAHTECAHLCGLLFPDDDWIPPDGGEGFRQACMESDPGRRVWPWSEEAAQDFADYWLGDGRARWELAASYGWAAVSFVDPGFPSVYRRGPYFRNHERGLLLEPLLLQLAQSPTAVLTITSSKVYP